MGLLSVITCGANLLWLFGVDLVKMKSLPSVYVLSFRHACNLMLLQCSHILSEICSFYIIHGLMLIL